MGLPGTDKMLLKKSLLAKPMLLLHEVGQALVAVFTQDAEPNYTVTIVPHSPILNMVTMLRSGHPIARSLTKLLVFMDVALGGQVAEGSVFGSEKVSSDAMNDISSATQMSCAMVTKYGVSQEVILFTTRSTRDKTLIQPLLTQRLTKRSSAVPTWLTSVPPLVIGSLRNQTNASHHMNPNWARIPEKHPMQTRKLRRRPLVEFSCDIGCDLRSIGGSLPFRSGLDQRILFVTIAIVFPSVLPCIL